MKPLTIVFLLIIVVFFSTLLIIQRIMLLDNPGLAGKSAGKDKYSCRKKSDPVEPGSDVIHLTDENFNDKTSLGVWLVEFYAPWCPHCKKLKPTWEETARKLTPLGINVAKVDATCEKKSKKQVGVDGFPTIRVINKGEVSEKYKGDRTYPNFKKFVEEQLGIKL
eukprot:TRINITY_DN37_c0_g1_i1.p1 TRINITY_DN37_c0_g1~~TRINITY_DN37_c0_g1_i1.p1  ORF type:complete len:165 (-),score=39.27 TRINITY_DN37_c0_g1_i1:173-667(-)